MKYKKIVLAGGSGCIGAVLAKNFKDHCEEIIILSRKARPVEDNITTLVWDAVHEGEWSSCLEDADLLINLTGKSVNCRYTPENKRAILDSRILSVKLLGSMISRLKKKPRLFINVTSATIYRHAEDHPQDEYNGEYGQGFSVEVCKAWEDTFFEQAPGVRKVALRMAIALSLKDGAFPRYLNLARLGLGGAQGNGRQMLSWIHEQEISSMIDFIYSRDDLSGIFNASAPAVVSNKEFMRSLRQTLGIPFGVPFSRRMLELGAVLAGTETELILKSRWVVPERLLREGYLFRFPDLNGALKNLLD